MKPLHLAASVLFLMLAACSPSASRSEAESADLDLATPTETNAQTAVETGTPAGPVATPTAISLELEVVESYSWTDERGFSWVEALVRNPYEYPVEIYQPTVRLLDSAGEIVVRIDEVFYLTGSGRGGLGQILPGETVAARFLVYNRFVIPIPEWESFQFAYDLEESTPIAFSTDFEISLSDFSYGDDNNFNARGTLKYTGDQTLRSLFVRVIFRDQNGNFIGSGEGFFDTGGYFTIEPGSSFDFFALTILPASFADVPFDYEVTAIGILAE